MSDTDKKQLSVIYGLVFMAVAVAVFVWSVGVGSPLYQKDDSRASTWLTSDSYTDYEHLNGSTNQSSPFGGNYTETVAPGLGQTLGSRYVQNVEVADF